MKWWRQKQTLSSALVAAKSKPPTLASMWRLPFVGVSLVVLGTMVATLAVVQAHQSSRDAKRLAGWAEAVQTQVAGRLVELHRVLDEWVTDPRLRSALADGEAVDWREVDALGRWDWPGASALHLRPLAEALSPSVDDPALSFAGRDLIREAARTGDVTPLEVHRLGYPERHLAIAQPVKDAGSDAIVGVLYVALPLSWLPEQLVRVPRFGMVRYQQRVGERLIMIDWPSDDGESPAIEPDRVVAIPGTRLVVAAWMERTGWPAAPGLLVPLGGALVVLMALAGLMLVYLYRRQTAAVVRDLERIATSVEALAASRGWRSPPNRFAETTDFATRLSPIVEGLVAATSQDTGGKSGKLERDEARGKSATAFETLAPELAALLQKGPARSITPVERSTAAMPRHLFRSNHIRGLAGTELPEGLARDIGLAIGCEIRDGSLDRGVFVGRDHRASSPDLAAALIDGLRESGCRVVDLDLTPAPVLAFAACAQGDLSGVMVTGGHSPVEYNGMKILLGGQALVDDGLVALYERILRGDLTTDQGGGYREEDMVEAYVERVHRDITLARVIKVVVHCGTGATSAIVPGLYRRLGCQVIEMACDPAGGLSNEVAPDPARPGDLADLGHRVVTEQADLGLAFDGDGARLGVVDSSGHFVASDRVLMLLATDILSRHPGSSLVCDLACSRHLASEILLHGGRSVTARSGPGRLQAQLRRSGGMIGGDANGHLVIGERWYGFADALYAGARLLEVLALDPRASAEVFTAMPASIATPEYQVPMSDDEVAKTISALLELARRLDGADLKTSDGLRADFAEGWGLVRADASLPGLTFRFEADDEAALAVVEDRFRALLGQAAPHLSLPF